VAVIVVAELSSAQAVRWCDFAVRVINSGHISLLLPAAILH
jgi:hypothetical protein